MALGAQAAEPGDSDRKATLSRLTILGELATYYLVSRPNVSASIRLVSLAHRRIHMTGNLGIGLASYSLAKPHVDLSAAVGLMTGAHAHHVELRAGLDVVSNTHSDTGPYHYPLLTAGYRYQRPRPGVVFTARLGTFGLGLGVGWAF